MVPNHSYLDDLDFADSRVAAGFMYQMLRGLMAGVECGNTESLMFTARRALEAYEKATGR